MNLNMIRYVLIGILLVAPTACGPGVGDFSDQIGNTPYYFSFTSSIGKQIIPSIECGKSCDSIESIVLNYDFNDSVIIAVRQVRNDYVCSVGHIDMEITSEIVFQYISLETFKVFGPYTESEFSKIMGNDKFKGLSLKKLKDKASKPSRVYKRSGCS